MDKKKNENYESLGDKLRELGELQKNGELNKEKIARLLKEIRRMTGKSDGDTDDDEGHRYID